MKKTKAYAAAKPNELLAPFSLERRDPGARDVLIHIEFCGVCHSDIHQVRDEWSAGLFPMVPGHEIIGRVHEVGREVRKYKVGDRVGVGCFVDSCRKCLHCQAGDEQFCTSGPAFTYNATEMDRKTPTYGGYSTQITVDEAYVVRIPDSLDAAAAAPLLCAGITTYSPLRTWKCKKGDQVGVVGLGGLGHMAVKLANAMGAEVTVLSTSPKKEPDAKRLGAHHFAVTASKDTFKKLSNHFDLIIDTVSADHDYGQYMRMVRVRGAMVLVGIPSNAQTIAANALINGNKILSGSSIGGIRETQEMLDYCGEHRITSDIEMIKIGQINEAYERMLRNDVRYRFVIDTASLA